MPVAESIRKLYTTMSIAGLSLFAVTCDASPAVTYDSRAKAVYGPIFTRVLQTFIGSKPGPNICLPPLFGFGDTVTDTADVNPDVEGLPMGINVGASRLSQFKALEAAGLVSSTESTRTVNGKTMRSLTYRRTVKGLAVSQGPSLCYARGELDRIVKWKGPVALGEYQAAFVYYTIKTTHIEDWAKTADVQAAFPAVAPIIKGGEAKVRQVVIDLSSEGWDIAEYSKYLQMQ
jgi:hypothetical protein